MGYTWKSVKSLILLILAYYMANLKAATRKNNAEMDTTHVRSSTRQLLMDTLATTEDPVSTKCRINLNEKLQNTVSATDNSSEMSDCMYSEHASADINSSTNVTEATDKVLTFRDFPEYVHYKRLERLSPYIMNIPGLITNPLTIFIAASIKPFHTSEIYMIALGCADLFTVTVRFTIRMLENYADTRYPADCKILSYMITTGQIYSNLILVSWTIERFIGVMYPIKLTSLCSIRNTKRVTVLLFLFSIGVAIPYIKHNDTIYNSSKMKNTCYFSEFMFAVWLHIESVYYIYLPMMCVCICNAAILYKLIYMSKARISMASSPDVIDRKTKENRKITILLLTISCSFLLLHIPYASALVLGYFYSDRAALMLEDPHTYARFNLYSACGYIIAEFQNCVNFFLYCISGTKFRLTFQNIFCKSVKIKKVTSQLPTTYATQFPNTCRRIPDYRY